MNVVSALVGITIASIAAPSVMKMTLAPVEAQARAKNFSTAEAAAVAFSAEWEGAEAPDWTIIPINCDDPVPSSANERGWDITCWGGLSEARGDDRTSDYYQEVTRSFRLAASNGASALDWDYDTPESIGSDQCQTGDEWGVNMPQGFNALHGDTRGACVPQVAWSERKYLASNPEQWLYDLRRYGDMREYPPHPYFEEE